MSKKPLYKSKYHEGDFWMLLCVAALTMFGLVMVFSASYYTSISEYGNPTHYLIRDAMWVGIGWVAFFIFSVFDYHYLRKLSWLALVLGFGLLVLLLVLPKSSPFTVTLNGAKRWLSFKGVTLMPGEVIKSSLVVFLASFFSIKEEQCKKIKYFWFPAGMIILAAGLVFAQPNLSTALTIIMLGGCIMIVSGLPARWFFSLLGLGVAGGTGLLAIKGADYMMARLDNFWDPFLDSLNKGYQVCQGILGFASGGVTGVGLGKSVQKALYLPEPMNDFILPIIGEELGFIGVVCLLIVYMMLVWRLFSISTRSKDRFGGLLAAAVGIHIGLQVLLNLAIVTASFPPTGVVLPLVSLGGSATALFMSELGIAYNVSKQTRAVSEEEVLEYNS